MRSTALALIAALAVSAVAFAQQPATEEIDELLRAQKWQEAMTRCTVLLAEDPENGAVWYRLGTARLQSEQFADAAEAFARAGEIGYQPEFAWYNAACSYALVGNVDKGIECLDKSLDAGFDADEVIINDPDIAVLRSDPRFAEIYTPPVYTPHEWAEPVSFPTDDEFTVPAVLYRARNGDGTPLEGFPAGHPVIILCHQSGSNHAEYQPIAPRLARMGYHALALDLRGGGKKYGRENDAVRTWMTDAGQRGRGTDAKKDMEAAIAWVRAQGFDGRVVLWGSSYTAGRLFEVVSDNPDAVAATISFSPGRGFAQPQGRNPSWAAGATAPALVTWTEHEFNSSRQSDFDTIAAEKKRLYVQEGGKHGSSTLHPNRNPDHYEAVWDVVEEFLATYAPVS